MHSAKLLALYVIIVVSFCITGCLTGEEDTHDHSGACVFFTGTNWVCRDNVSSEQACDDLSTQEHQFYEGDTCENVFY